MQLDFDGTTTDVLLLSDIFETFTKVCSEKHGLDPTHYCNAPDLNCDALLKRLEGSLSSWQIKICTFFIAREMRGRISMVIKHYVKVNNQLVERYDPVTQELLQQSSILM